MNHEATRKETNQAQHFSCRFVCLRGSRLSARFRLALCVLLACVACASGQDFSRYDLSTNEGVNAAREEMRGKPLDNKSKNCVHRNPKLPEIVLVGGFAYDRGCMFAGAFVGTRYFAAQDNLSGSALTHLGWAKADGKKREELAVNWVRYGLLTFDRPLTSATEDFVNEKFDPPAATTDEQHVVVVSLWNQKPAGRRCERAYDKLSFAFAEDGSFKERSRLTGFSVPCRQ